MAWGSLFWPQLYHNPPNYQDGYTRHGPGFSDWFVEVYGASGFRNAFSSWTNGISTYKGGKAWRYQAEDVLPDWAGFAYPNGTYPPNTKIMRLVDARGWPTLTLWSGREVIAFTRPGATVGNSISITRGYLLPGDRNKPFSHYSGARILPFAPIWPGFAINTVFYAVLLWMLWLSPFVVRRFVRRKHGLCIKCGYDLRGAEHDVCPECGWRQEESLDERTRHHGPRFRARADFCIVVGAAAVGLVIYFLFTGFWNGAWFCLPIGVVLLARWVWMMITGHGG